MSRAILRQFSGLTAAGLFAYLVTQLPNKQKRLQNRRRRILASYEAAANDPEFMAEFGETMREWDATSNDALEAEVAAC
jgi:hypothetical protein